MLKHKKLAECCKAKLNLANAKLSEEYYYQSLPLCVIDAVFSIGIRYTATRNTVINFCEKQGIKRVRPYGSRFSPTTDQMSVTEFLEIYAQNTIDVVTEKYFNNRCRTSSSNGILKSEATRQFCEVLKKHKVDFLQNVSTIIGDEEFEEDIKLIAGQKSGISTTYFYMLAGDEDFIKPDRMVFRFVDACLGVSSRNVADLSAIIKDSHAELKENFPTLTLRELDHEIWKYQKNS